MARNDLRAYVEIFSIYPHVYPFAETNFARIGQRWCIFDDVGVTPGETIV